MCQCECAAPSGKVKEKEEEEEEEDAAFFVKGEINPNGTLRETGNGNLAIVLFGFLFRTPQNEKLINYSEKFSFQVSDFSCYNVVVIKIETFLVQNWCRMKLILKFPSKRANQTT